MSGQPKSEEDQKKKKPDKTIGTDACTINHVMQTLHSDPEIFEGIRDTLQAFQLKLQTPKTKQVTLTQDLFLRKMNLLEVVHELVHEWVARKGSCASLHYFLSFLVETGNTKLAEKLATRYQILD